MELLKGGPQKSEKEKVKETDHFRYSASLMANGSDGVMRQAMEDDAHMLVSNDGNPIVLKEGEFKYEVIGNFHIHFPSIFFDRADPYYGKMKELRMPYRVKSKS